jgi:imidazolonepropionase-like amidohydrolase
MCCLPLDKEQALQLITSNGKILGIDAQCGTLEIGKDTLFLSAGDALDRTNKISHAFIQVEI